MRSTSFGKILCLAVLCGAILVAVWRPGRGPGKADATLDESEEAHAKTQALEFLAAEDPFVNRRGLRIVAGGSFPWPFRTGGFESRQAPRKSAMMPQFAPAVEKLLDRKDPKVRQLAAAVFAALAGKAAVPRMRRLLDDVDGNVRAVAVGTLIRHDDRASWDAIFLSVRGMRDCSVSCQVVELLRGWEAPQAVPALIEFLQHDRSEYIVGDDLGVPALDAQAALKALTGHDFPRDVKASQNDWEKVKAIDDPGERVKQLARILAYDPHPFEGKLVSEKKGEVIVVKNRSRQPVVVAKRPALIDFRWRNGIGTIPQTKRPKSKDDYTTLAPGDSLRIEVNPEHTARPRLTRLTVSFLSNGNDVGLNAWIGTVEVQFDPK
jgi:hypothetical protein